MSSRDLRIGDTERESAIQVLGEHFSAGRLDVDEYGERSAKITTAKTAGELDDLFADLPAPHPTPPGTTPPQPQPARPGSVTPRSGQLDPAAEARPSVDRWQARPPIQRAAGALVGVSWIVGIGLMIALHGAWMFIFLPMVLSAVFGSIWGRGWERDHHEFRREQRRDRHRGGDWRY